MSFQKLWENMQSQKNKSSHDDKSMSVIRTGLGVDENFWDNFLQVINNSEGLSQLLDVPTTKISSWHSKVREVLDKVKEADSTPDLKDSGKLLKTGQSDEVDPNAIITTPKGMS